MLLVILNSRWFSRGTEESPIIYRPPVDPLARQFVYCFAIAPALGGSLIAGIFNFDRVTGGAGIALLMWGLAAIVATGDLVYLRRQRLLRAVWALALLVPAFAADRHDAVPAMDRCGRSVRRRCRRPRSRASSATILSGAPVSGFARWPAIPRIATLISLDKGRPHLLLDATPERTPWLNAAKFAETGGVVVWRASDTAGTPPADIAKRFPGLVPEVPRAFEWYVNGRQPLLRIGWAIVRPKTP